MSNSSLLLPHDSHVVPAPAPSADQNPLLPGLALCGTVAIAAYGLRLLPGGGSVSPMIIAIVVGMAVGNLMPLAPRVRPGIVFAMRRLLRLAIILLGLQLTFAQVAETGWRGLFVIAVTLVATYAFTLAAGRLMRIDDALVRLIAAGTSVCGASAVAGANSVVAADDADVSYAVACVTLFGSIAMLAYPLLAGPLGLAARDYGLWAGASIHEIAQVAAATFALGGDAGAYGTTAKLTRVMMLAPLVLAMARGARCREPHVRSSKVPVPWFVVGFVALVAVNSLITVPPAVKQGVGVFGTALLTVALAAMGIETRIAALRARGLRPALLGAVASLFIAAVSLLLIKLT